MVDLWSSYRRLDRDLAAKGFHSTSDWWLAQTKRFYQHPTATSLVARVGRGGSKSFTSAKRAVNELVFGDWHVPPGEVHYYTFISENREEAANRIRLIKSMLSALGLGHEARGDTIELTGLPLGFKVLAARIGAVSGWRSIGYTIDEAAKIAAKDGFANPAHELAASADAMCITHPGARSALISSPMATLDYHYERYEQGDTAYQITAHAESWIANPGGITRDDCIRQSRGDDRIFRREYCAVPMAAISAVFPPNQIEDAFRELNLNAGRFRGSFGFADPNGGGADRFAWGVASWWVPDPTDPETRIEKKDGNVRILEVGDTTGANQRPILVFRAVHAAADKMTSEAVIHQMAQYFRKYGVQTVFGDQFGSFFLESWLPRYGLRYHTQQWSNPTKATAVDRLKRFFRDRSILLPPNERRLRNELAAYSEKVTPGGSFKYEGASGHHDDMVALLVNAAMADRDGWLVGSPYGYVRPPYRNVVNLPPA